VARPLTPGECGQVIVFFSSCNSVKYHAELLNYIDLPVTPASTPCASSRPPDRPPRPPARGR
jgi:hypothetical protein